MKHKIKIILLLTAVIFLLILTTIKFPYIIKEPCSITAQQEWALIQVEPDKLLSRIFDNETEMIINFTLIQFDREDFVQFSIDSALIDQQIINTGDPIARIYSSDNHLILTNLVGELEKALTKRSIMNSGEKKALQEEARQSLNMAQVQFDAFIPQYQRKKKLFEQKLIGIEEWQIAQSTYDLYQVNINMQSARLEAVQSGEKKEMIKNIDAEIGQIQGEIELLKEKLDLEMIKSPLSGIVTDTKGDSIICQVELIDTLLLKIAVSALELKYISSNLKITAYIQETANYYEASIIKVGNRSRTTNAGIKYIITARVKNTDNELMPGMSGYAKIHCDKVSLITQFSRTLKRYMGFNI
jgi:hypothetical protein